MATPVEILINGRDNTAGAFGSAGGSLAKIGQIAAGILASQVFTKLAGAAVEFGKSVFTEAMDAQNNMAQLDAVLASTAGQAGVTREAALALADSLSGVTRFSDDAILKGENMLLTFTNIGSDIFPQATQAILDMSTALGQDMQSSAIQLGKALNDPVAGVTALQRVGVKLTDEQKKQVEGFMKVNDIASAQAIILKELQTEFGGSAEAAGKTFAGQMDILNNKFNNLKEGLGLKLMPMIQQFADKLIAFADNPAVLKFFDDMAVGAQKIFDWAMKLPASFDGAKKGVMDFITPFIPAIQLIIKTLDQMRPTIEKVAATLGGKLAAAGKELSSKVFPFLVTTMNKFSVWLAQNRPLIEAFATHLGAAFANIAQNVVAFWSVVSPILSGLFDIILSLGTLIMQLAEGDWAGAWQSMSDIVSTAFTAIGEAVVAALDWIAGLMGTSLAQIQAQWTSNWNALKSILSSVWSIIKSTINTALANIKAYFTDAWGNIISSVTSFTTTLRNSFTNAWAGIISGISTFAGNLRSSITTAIYGATAAVQSAIGGFVALGGRIIDNIIDGIRSNASALIDYLKDIISNLIGNIFGGGDTTTGGGGGGGGGGCFIAGTMVLMADGSIKRIENVEVGDVVASFDTSSRQFIKATISETFEHLEGSTYLIINGHLGVTTNHLIFVNGQWIAAGEIKIGDCILNSDDKPVWVYSIQPCADLVAVYNLHTNHETHNYFAGGVLVHNVKALGGNVYAGNAYMVGEVGQELFVPATNGMIIPNNQLGGTGSSSTYNQYYNAHVTIYTGKTEQRKSMKGFI